MDLDLAVRVAAFNWLAQQTQAYGDVLPRQLLARGFDFEGKRIPLVSPQGIFKPRILALPLSITTSPNGPYEDSFNKDNLLIYRYRGTDPTHNDNVGLRNAMKAQRPLVYFHGVVPGRYLAIWPVYIVEDSPTNLSVTVAVDEMPSVAAADQEILKIAEPNPGKRAYLTALVKRRLHQRSFREQVLQAYRSQCAVCRLKHRELLDASHIIPDHEEASWSTVTNGLALCKLHHAAFDSFMLGISPDHRVVVRDDIREETDGPVLKHGLQALHQTKILLPRKSTDWPRQDALEWRYDQFLRASP